MNDSVKGRRPRRKCVFCPRTDMSREHLWAQWTWAVLPPDDQVVTRQKLSIGGLAGLGGTAGAASRVIRSDEGVAGNLRRRRAKVVCERCNNGWMSVVETGVKLTLSPVLSGSDVSWLVEDLRLIALWVEKTALVHEADNRKGAAREWMRYRLRTSQAASPESRIWVAKTNDPGWSAGTFTRSFAFVSGARAALTITTMSLGPLVFTIMTPYGPHGIPGQTVALPAHTGMRQIWPALDAVNTTELPWLTNENLSALWNSTARALDEWGVRRNDHPLGVRMVPLGITEQPFGSADLLNPRTRQWQPPTR